jgi:hypothetical protein
MQVAVPEPIPVEIRPLDSLICDADECRMTVDDFMQHEADITALGSVKQAYELELQSIARAYNEAITSAMHRDIAAQYSAQEAEETRKAFERYRLSESLRTWLERVGFLLGAYLLSL